MNWEVVMWGAVIVGNIISILLWHDLKKKSKVYWDLLNAGMIQLSWGTCFFLLGVPILTILLLVGKFWK